MGGVAGWWDETSDPGVADALDALAGMSGEEAAQAVEESVEKVQYDEEPVSKEQYEKYEAGLKETPKISGVTSMVISPDTSGWVKTPITYNIHSGTSTLSGTY